MDDIEQIKTRVNIVELIQEYLPLKKAGVNYKGVCPFHQEKSPSFMVSEERGIWHCFGCDKGGDVFKFVMEKEGWEFKEALEYLAQKAGITLKRTKSKETNTSDVLYEIHQKASQFYHYLLTEHELGKKALEYLHKRGITPETIKTFQIGYAPQSWESLTRFLKKRGYTVEQLIESGLCVESKRGCYDRFRGRVVFPLSDVRNRIMGFSGRILGVGEPKYINSPQTPIFDKGKFLLGLNLSKGPVKEKNQAIIVEGEMDMLMSYQAGVKQVTASKGTALTEFQVDTIKKYTDTILLCFDTDLAGDAAARRGIEIADKAGLNIKVIQFEGAKDPADLILKDPKLWKQAVEHAIPIYDYYLQSAERRFKIKTPEGKRAIFRELAPIWKKISDPIQKDQYTQRLANLLMINEEIIKKEIEKEIQQYVSPQHVTVSPKTERSETSKKEKLTPQDRRKSLERLLIAMLLHIPIDHTYVPSFPETLITQEELKQIYVLLVLHLDSISFQGKAFKINEFISTLPDDLSTIVDQLYLMQIDEKLEDKNLWQKELDTVVQELKKMLIKTSLEKLTLQIKNAQEFDNMETLEVLNRRFRDLSIKLKSFK
jgi:DNA primase